MQIAIVITDGKQTTRKGPYTELSVASSGLTSKKVQVYSLGIGKNVDGQQLVNITGSKNKVFFADSFAALTSVAPTIVLNSCPGRFFFTDKTYYMNDHNIRAGFGKPFTMDSLMKNKASIN